MRSRSRSRILAAVATFLLATVPLTVAGAAHAITTSPTSLAFGTVAVGSTTTLPLEITISAGYTAGGSSLSGTGIVYFSQDSGCVGAVGPATCTTNITYNPTTTGTHTVTLGLAECQTGGGSCNNRTVSLTGTTVAPPVVTAVSAATPDDTYKVGANISVTVTFDQPVTVDITGGTPTLLLETGTVDRTASYVAGSGSTTWTFHYTVQAGDHSTELDYTSTSALATNGAVLSTTVLPAWAGTPTLPAPGAPGSLAANSTIVVDGVAPTATLTLDDTYLTPGQAAQLGLTFTEPVTGLTVADLVAGAGTVSGLGSADGGTTWIATLTPAPGTYRTGNTVTLDQTGITDAAGNTGAGTATSPTYTVDTVPHDTTAPTSQATGPARVDTTSWTVSYTATDVGFGVTSVDLYARAPGETGYRKVATDSTDVDGRFTYTAAAGDGDYAFYTVATDAAGNTETAPGTPDVTTVLDTVPADTTAPVLTPRMGRAPVHFDISDQAQLALRVLVNEPASVEFKIRAHGTLIRAWPWRHDVTGLVEQRWNGRADGHRVAAGRYRAVFVATDAAGNRSVARVPLRVTR